MYKAKYNKDQMPLSLKMSLIHGVSFYDHRLYDYEFYDNDYSFYREYQNALSPGYNPADWYARINADGYAESFTRYDAEEKVDGVIDDVIEKYIELLNAGRVSDWYGLFEEVKGE